MDGGVGRRSLVARQSRSVKHLNAGARVVEVSSEKKKKEKKRNRVDVVQQAWVKQKDCEKKHSIGNKRFVNYQRSLHLCFSWRCHLQFCREALSCVYLLARSFVCACCLLFVCCLSVYLFVCAIVRFFFLTVRSFFCPLVGQAASSLFVFRCSLFDVRCSLFDVRCSMFDVRCSLFVIRCSLFAVRCSLFVVHCSLLPPLAFTLTLINQ